MGPHGYDLRLLGHFVEVLTLVDYRRVEQVTFQRESVLLEREILNYVLIVS